MIVVTYSNMTVRIKHVTFVGPNKTPYFQIAVPAAIRHKFNGLTKITKRLTGSGSSVAQEAAELHKHHKRMFTLLSGDVAGNISDKHAQALLLLEKFGNKPGDAHVRMDVPIGMYDQPHLTDIYHAIEMKEANGTATEIEKLARLALQGPLPILMSETVDVYFQNHRKGTNQKFREGTLLDWNKLIKFFPDQPLINLDRTKAREFMDERLSKVKTTSFQREVNTIRAIINVVIREKNLQMNNPFETLIIPNYKHDSINKEPFTIEEHKLVIKESSTKTEQVSVMVLLCALTGARIGEIAGLRIQDLHLDEKVPFIEITEYANRTVKTKQSVRKVPLVPIGVESVKKLIANQTGITLFPRYADGIEVNNTNASAAANKYLKRLGVTKTMHCARHSMRDLLRAADVTSDYAFEIGGWGSQMIGDTYGAGHSMEKKMNALSRALAFVL